MWEKVTKHMLTPLTNIKIWHDQVSQAMIYDVLLYRVRFTLKINLEDSTAVIDTYSDFSTQIHRHLWYNTMSYPRYTELCPRVHTAWRSKLTAHNYNRSLHVVSRDRNIELFSGLPDQFWHLAASRGLIGKRMSNKLNGRDDWSMTHKQLTG